jgi:diguanylate cyclase (GGDEF)-like protein
MKIAIIDDEPFTLRILERQISEIPGLTVVKFEDPEAAIAWCQEDAPDLVLVDYVMPKLDGIEVIRRLRGLPDFEHTPIIMLTGMKDRALLLKALEHGANDFLRKPADLLEMKARISSMLKLRSAALGLKAANAALVDANQELTRLATIDPLTEVYNRRYFLDRADDEFARARRYGGIFSVVMLDVDHFKRINDSHGHGGGDIVLKHLCRLVGELLRTMDYLGRLGGEEFAICLPETDAPGAQLVAERIRVALAEARVLLPSRDGEVALAATASLGVATFGAADKDFAALLNRADAALYRAKSAGRNQVAAAVAATEPAISD